MATATEYSENEQKIGAILKQARIRTGYDISTMAHLLRIRQPYLEAIELGRYDQLPGPAYATGFIRTYAEQLGLDGEQFVQRFREETSETQKAVELQFPSPVADSGRPTGQMIAIGLLLLVLAYGAWHFFDEPSLSVSEWIPPIPDQLASLLPGATPEVDLPSDEAETAASSSETSPAVTSPRAESPPTEPEAVPEADTAATLTTAPLNPIDGDDSPEVAGVTSTEGVDSPPTANIDTGDAVGDAASDQTAALPSTPEDAVEPVDEQPNPEDAPTTAPETDDQQPANADATRVFGDATDARIVLRATQDSWIEVRDPAGNDLLLARLLKPGDVYLVPNRNGLTLLTGNAGGLDVYVDGELTSPLGAAGVVRKGVALDADALSDQPVSQ